jgi:septum site-determining protein MinC
MHEDTVAIKGIRDGLLITLSPTEEWRTVTADLATRIDKQGDFFTGATITVELGERPVPKDELASLIAVLERRGLSLAVVLSDSETTVQAAQALDIRTREAGQIPGKQAIDDTSPTRPTAKESEDSAVIIRRTLRSGQTAHSRGHVIVVGDVNAGAEIVASGNIIVWGRLRGNVHAGADGNENAIVCALDMVPTQLRLAGYIVTSPDEKHRDPKPEIAMIRDSQIVVETWSR